MPTIEETISFIKDAHAGQVDKAGKAYYHHPVAVMRRLPSDIDDDVKMAALLHDVIEDTSYTRQRLAELGYSERTLDAVELVTQKPDDARPYAEKIDAIIASGNRDAIEVKFADMSENFDPSRLAALEPERRDYFIQKYSGPIEALKAALAE